MEYIGGFLYADQAAAEEAAGRHRSELINLVEYLEELNESIDSAKLARLIADKKFTLGL